MGTAMTRPDIGLPFPAAPELAQFQIVADPFNVLQRMIQVPRYIDVPDHFSLATVFNFKPIFGAKGEIFPTGLSAQGID